MIGKTVLHYKILEQLGEGGMGVVYKAEDTKLKRSVAIKFLSPSSTQNAEAKERFLREAQAASMLDHSNICTIHEINETEDGQLFIVMAHYGSSLQEKIEGDGIEPPTPMPVNEALDLAIQIARGLAKAHAKNIVHRDIKPANILITEDEQAKIADFGLAKLGRRSVLTQEGTTLGTISYMSPEQAQGAEVDHRTDIWALGVILYEMLTCKSPFPGEHDQVILYSILSETHKPLTDLRSDIPLKFEQIINKCLKKDAGDRYQEVNELIVDLGRLRGDSNPADLAVQMPGRVRKKRSLVLLLSGMILGSAILGAFLHFGLFRETAGVYSASVAVLPFKNRSVDKSQEYFSDGLTEELLNNLAKIKSLRVPARTSSFAFKDKDVDIKTIGEKLNVDYVLEGSVRRSDTKLRISVQLAAVDNGFHIWSETYDKKITDVFDIQDEIAGAIVSVLRVKLLGEESQQIIAHGTSNSQAYDAYLLGRHHLRNRDKESLEASINAFEKAIQRDATFAQSYSGLADATYLLNVYYYSRSDSLLLSKTENMMRQGLDINPDLAEIQTTYAKYLSNQKKFSEAEIAYQKAIELNPNYIQAYHWYGGYLFRDRLKFNEALKIHETAIQLDPLSISLLSNLSLDLQALARYDEAQKTKERIIEVDKESRFGYVNLMEHYLKINGDAFKTIEIGLDLSERLYEEVPGAYDLMKSAYLAVGDLEKAESYCQQYIRATGDSSSILDLYWYADKYDDLQSYLTRLKSRESTFSNNRTIAFYECQLGNYAMAIEYYKKIYPALFEEPLVTIRNYYYAPVVAYAFLKLGETEKATDLAKKALAFYGDLPRFGWPYAYDENDIIANIILGEKQKAIQALKEDLAGGGRPWLWWFGKFPVFEELLKDPGVIKFVKQAEAELVRQRIKTEAL